MYTPSAFASSDLGLLDALMERDAFVTMVTVSEGVPCVSHLPLLYARTGDDIVLRGHWARANAQTRHVGEALVIAHGPHAYVSPGWYPDKHTAARVPTWNYVVAHLSGPLETFDDTETLADLVDDLSRQHESRVGGAWALERDSDAHMRQMRGIVGFRMAVARVELKFKLSQNHPRANRDAVTAALDGFESAGMRDVASWMRRCDPDIDSNPDLDTN